MGGKKRKDRTRGEEMQEMKKSRKQGNRVGALDLSIVITHRREPGVEEACWNSHSENL